MHYRASTSTSLRGRLRSAGSDITTSSSYTVQRLEGVSGTASATNSTDTAFHLSPGNASTCGLNLLITNPFETTQTGIVYTGGSNEAVRSASGRQSATSSSDGFTIFPSTGTLTDGTIDIFGYRTT